MIKVKKEKSNYVVTFNSNDIPNNFINKLLRKAEIEDALSKSKLKEEDAFNLSEEAKESWWQKKQRLDFEKS
jgi:hypothetical protein